MGEMNFKFDELAGVEIMEYVLLFCEDWTDNDFRIAFRKSRLGQDYYLSKIKDRIEFSNYSRLHSVIEILLGMDMIDRQLLFDYLFNIKYLDKILKYRDIKMNIDEISKIKNIKPKEDNESSNS